MNFILDRFPLEVLREALKELAKSNHKVKICTTTFQSSNLLKKDEEFLIDRSITRGEYFNDIPWVINHEIIKNLSKYESLVQPLFSRYSLNQSNFTPTEISTHYQLLINFWIFNLTTKNISACFHYYAPHDPGSFVLHICCKYLKIPNIFIDCAHLFVNYRYLSSSFSNRSLLLVNQIRKPLQVNNLVSKLRFNIESNSDAALPKFIINRNQNIGLLNKIKKIRNFIKTNINRKYLFDRLAKIKNLFLIYPTYFKTSRHDWNSKKSEFTRLKYEMFILILKIKLLIKKRKYNSICSGIPNNKFVYFAAPAQPEATTIPSALYYSNLIIALKTLRAGLPDEIDILFKENLSIFETRNPYISGVLFKAPDYYEKILKIKGLKFVNCSYSSIDLIKKSVAVATINGTAAIEAIALNKKAFIFSSNWYESFPYIYRVNNPEIIAKQINYDEGNLNLEIPEKICIDKEVMIKFNSYNPYVINNIKTNELISKYLLALEKFQEYEENDLKWLI